MTTETKTEILVTPNKEDLRSLTRYGNERSYEVPPGTDQKPSVTTLIKGGEPKPALTKWASKMTAEAAVASHDLIGELIGESAQGAVDWLKDAPNRSSDKAAFSGTLLHDYMEARILGVTPPDLGDDPRALATFRQIDHFLETVPIEWLAIETVCFNENPPYAGTLDGIGIPLDGFGPDEVGKGKVLMLDLKTGKAVYGGAAAQMAAYMRADSLYTQNGIEPMIETEGAAVIHVTPDGWQVVPVVTDDETYQTFLAMMQLSEWSRWKGTGMRVVQSPLAQGRHVAAVSGSTPDLSEGTE